MAWNWTFSDWPNFRFNDAQLAPLEQQFLLAAGEVIGAVRHVTGVERDALRIELLSEEALKTAQIEGEVLDRASVQSSLRRHFGLDTSGPQARPQERGIAELLGNVYDTYANPLDQDTLFRWHAMLMAGNRNISSVGSYRSHADTMQIVSGQMHDPTIHFEAPPSSSVASEMAIFIDWFNETAPNGKTPLPPLTRAGLGHLYFESIHPFEDGNGRLGRALAEKSLAQNIDQPSLIALAYTIERKRKAYYDQLSRHQTTLEITDWLVFFSETVLEAQRATVDRVGFHIAKTRFYDHFRERLNDRQAKAIARIFQEGPDGFTGGLSAENYIAITRASRSTATRDLQDLVAMKAFLRKGELRHTRYSLNLPRTGI